MADIADTLAEWSSTTASNAPSGATTIGTGLDDNLREIQGVITRGLSHKGSDIASAGTMDIGAVEGLMHDITGTTTVTGLGTVRAGIWKVLKYEGAVPVIHNGTSLILLGGADRTMANGDTQIVTSEGSGNWREVAFFAAANGPSKVLQAVQATTSGTTVDFTIPAWAKKVTVMLNGVSTDGTEELMVQLGVSGTPETTGYAGASSTHSGSTTVQHTTGFLLQSGGVAAATVEGHMTLVLMDAATNKWSQVSTLTRSDSAAVGWGGSGTKPLAGTLDLIRLTTTGTPDDFDAGSVSVLVE